MTPKSSNFRQQIYREKMEKSGCIRVNVWVPFEDRERLKRYAEKLRLQNAKKNLA